MSASGWSKLMCKMLLVHKITGTIWRKVSIVPVICSRHCKYDRARASELKIILVVEVDICTYTFALSWFISEIVWQSTEFFIPTNFFSDQHFFLQAYFSTRLLSNSTFSDSQFLRKHFFRMLRIEKFRQTVFPKNKFRQQFFWKSLLILASL